MQDLFYCLKPEAFTTVVPVAYNSVNELNFQRKWLVNDVVLQTVRKAQTWRRRRKKKEGGTGRKSQQLLQPAAVEVVAGVLQRAVLVLVQVLDQAQVLDQVHVQALVLADRAVPVQVQELAPRPLNAKQEVAVGAAAKVRLTAAAEARVQIVKIRKRKMIRKRQLKSLNPSQEAGPHHL